jgi:glycosyltransferase involved in cell wall biosynthesis
MKNKPLVSIIVPTKNSESTISACLKSIKSQSYKNLEIIVVDNNSADKTKDIASKYTKKLVFNKGPERSAQRNFGADKAKGNYLLFIDSDMTLDKNVIKDCVKKVKADNYDAIIIPEISFGTTFWSKVKAFERSYYVNNDDIEAARFYSKKVFFENHGFNEELIAGEDWDLSDRIRKKYRIGRIDSFIKHNEGELTLFNLLKKKFYYAKNAKRYLSENQSAPISKKIPILRPVFYKDISKIFRNPILFVAMITMLLLETIIGGVGLLEINSD